MLKYADSAQMYWLRVALAAEGFNKNVTSKAMYAVLELYYLNNGVYDVVNQVNFDNAIWTEGMKGFRNPAHRTVEFYVSKIWPGQLPDALPIVTDNKAIIEPIQQIWEWSDWSTKKQLSSRWFSLFGDLFIKTATATPAGSDDVSRVYLQNIKPYYVTSMDLDERGFLVYLRLDVPKMVRDANGKTSTIYHTELWDKSGDSYRKWIHDRGDEADIGHLGTPDIERAITDFGFDFIPFVHAKFQDVGDKRGVGAFTHALDKIDEANRQATRLPQMLFRYNRPLWAASAGGMDKTGRPLPPPRIGRDNTGTQESDTITIGDDTLLTLPGASTLEPLVPNINYTDALAILQDHMMELEKDLPELAYYRLRDLGSDISGRAIRLLLSDAVDKAAEARGNAESALARAHAMALTIGAQHGLFKRSIGTFEKGSFEHTFGERPIIPRTEKEKAEEVTSWTTAGVPLITALKRAGWSDDEIKQMEKDKKAEDEQKQNSFAEMALAAQRRFDAGNNPPQNGGDGEDQQDGQQAPA